jgi:bifunctional non-homologous end joining protein LigD
MPLVRLPEPFDATDWLFEIKHDGFRALAYVDGHQCRLVSRRGHQFTAWDVLRTEISHGIRARNALLDGEIVCLDDDGKSNFHKLLFRRDWPYFYVFDLLALNGDDLTPLPLLERKRRLREVMPRVQSRLLYVDHLERRGCGLYHAACERDLESVVAKWAKGPYHNDGVQTSWIKIKNPEYSQAEGRHELFDRRRDMRRIDRGRWRSPVLSLQTDI